MGIQGLLPFLKKIHTPVNISQFKGSTVAVDAYCWLHKGAFSCAEKLALGEKTDQYVYYCMKYINNLQKHDLKVIMVFDGCHLESKAGVEKSRRERRESNRRKAAQFLREGKRSEAKECLQRCVDITPQMALELMNACRARGVDCIVAPYEADAQLAFLSNSGIAQIIITEDSDLLLFGCEKIVFKMDFHGNGTLIEKSRLNEVMGVQTDFYTFDKFRLMCILSGCDYLPSISGIGLAKANKVFKTARQGDVRQVLKKLPTYLKINITVSNEYVEGFIRANNTFLYQLVYDPLTRSLKPLNPLPPELKKENLNYAGTFLPQDLAYQIALGNIDIHTKDTIGHFDPDKQNIRNGPISSRSHHLLSIWDKRYSPGVVSSPCKEINTAETMNRNNHKASGVGKNVVISTDGLKKMLAKKKKETQPVMTNEEMAALYAGDYENDYHIKRARKNLMESSDGFNAISDPVANEEISQEKEEQDSVPDASDDTKEAESTLDLDNKLDICNDSFQYTAANIGEETFKKTSGESVKENKASVKGIESRNIFAVSKTSVKTTTKISAVEVKSWYFSSPKKSSVPVIKVSPTETLSVTNVSPIAKVKHKSECSPLSIRSMFQRYNDNHKTISNSSPKKNVAESKELNKLSLESPSDRHEKKISNEMNSKNRNNERKKSKTNSLSKLSAFSWSRAISVKKIVANDEDRLTLCREDSLGSHSCKRALRDSDGEDSDIVGKDSPMEPSSKMRKTSLNTSSYFEKKRPTENSLSQDSDVDKDVQEIQYQSYEGFLRSVSDDSYTKLLDESKAPKNSSESVVSHLSKSLDERLREEGKETETPKRKCLAIESLGVIDLTKDPEKKVKSACRVSGLSKNKSKQRSLDSQQPKIKNFFSKYSFERKKLPQMKPTDRMQEGPKCMTDNTEEDDDGQGSCTPVMNSLPEEIGHVKRKLSL